MIRLNPDEMNKEIVKVSLEKIIEDKNSSENLKLYPGDLLRVYSKESFNQIKPVFIYGGVRNPGKYEFKVGMVLKDIILEAGGLNTEIPNFRVEISRNVNRNEGCRFSNINK